MATVNCPGCGRKFNPSNYYVKGGSAVAGAAAGAWLGTGIGLAGGPLGAIAGTIPGAIIGFTVGYLGIGKFTRCPSKSCKKVFLV